MQPSTNCARAPENGREWREVGTVNSAGEPSSRALCAPSPLAFRTHFRGQHSTANRSVSRRVG